MPDSTKNPTTEYLQKLRERVHRLIMSKAMLDNITETHKVVIQELNEILNPIKP